MGFERPLRMAITPAIVVVLTAPRPTSKTPSFPWAGAISDGCFTEGIYQPASGSRQLAHDRRPQDKRHRQMAGGYHESGMTIIFKMLKKRSGRSMDPLHVSMTGVKMGERFVMIGCDDRALMAGLAAKVGPEWRRRRWPRSTKTSAQRATTRRREDRRADRRAADRRRDVVVRRATRSTWSWSTTRAAASRRNRRRSIVVPARSAARRARRWTDRSRRRTRRRYVRPRRARPTALHCRGADDGGIQAGESVGRARRLPVCRRPESRPRIAATS